MQLRTKGITWSVDTHTIIKDVSLEVKPGEFVGLIGPNGSGKSSMLRTVYRVLRPDAGLVSLDDTDVWQMSARDAARKTAVVAQERSDEFDFRVHEIVMMGRTPHKGIFEQDNATDEALVTSALERVNMLAYRERQFNTLSGGEKQRVLIARALAQQTQFLVLDEPTNHLDIRYQLEILELVKGLTITKLTALHDLNLAAAYCDRLYLLTDGQVAASGKPTEVLTPERIYAAYGVRAQISQHPITGQLHLAFASIPS